MNDLINITGDEQMVSARELHEKLEIETPFRKWFPRMCEYGFEDGKDFRTKMSETSKTGGRPALDYNITIEMAKEICMIQRTPKGKEVRQYLIQLERAWNTPELVIARGLQASQKLIAAQTEKIALLSTELEQKSNLIETLQPKATYYDLILQCPDLISVTEIAKDYGMSAKTMNAKLHELGIQFKQSGRWFLYSKYEAKGYTQSKTSNYSRPDGTQGCSTHMYWTQKGRLFLYEELKKVNTVPMIERDQEDYA